MNIVICGAGEVGRHSAEVLAPAGHNITIIDQSEAKLGELTDSLDARVMLGNATQADVLVEAGATKADLLIAATNIDEINLLSASVAKAVGCAAAIARVHHSAYFEKRGLDYARHLGIDHLVCPEYSTAQAIAATLRSPGALAVESFARGKIEMQSLPVSGDAPGVGRALRDLDLPRGCRIAAIEHEGEASIPSAETRIQAGDVVTLIGGTKNFEKLRKLFDTKAGTRRRVVVLGGSTQGVWVCRALQHRNFSVRLFEADPERAEDLAEKLPWITVLSADAVNQPDTLTEERVEQADAFVAVTNDDETNILMAARAKAMGLRNAIAVLQRSTYLHLLPHVGIDKAFSPRATAVTEIQRWLIEGPVRPFSTLRDGIAEVFEVRVGRGSTKVVDKPLRSVAMPGHTLVAAIQRGEEVFVPGADDTVQAKDVLMVIGPASVRKELRRLFGG